MSARAEAVATMLGARSIAVVGASPRPDSFGARMVAEALRGSARVHLVNPRHNRIGEHRCAPSLADLDEPVDLVLLGVPDAVVVDQLQAAADAGARSAVVFGSAHGRRAQVAEVALAAGMAVCGAGCMGFVNTVAAVRALGYLEPDPLPAGPVSLVTHSGSAFSTLLRAHRGFGFRLAVSSGQELVTDTADYIDHALLDDGTRLIALLLETPRAVPRLRAALLRAADAGVPVIILTIGGSPRGRAMVAAHSGALAGKRAAWQAFCTATGAVHVTDMAEFTDTIELFASGRRSRGGRIATVHDSGAERALTVDLAHDLGVDFAALTPGTTATIAGLLDDGLAPTNPLDVWGTGADTRNLFGACLRAMVDDPTVAVTALAVDLVTEYDGDTAYADAVTDVAKQTDAPLAVLASVASAIDRPTAQRLRDNGVPVLEGLRSGLAAMAHLAAWPRSVDRAASAGPGPTRATGFDLLAHYGIPVVPTRAADSAETACDAAAQIGYPVAVKTAALQHKSDVGGVRLGVTGKTGLRAAYRDLARLGPAVTVSAMAPPGVEVSVGFVRDPAFGPLVVVAAGGTLVELLADRVLACPPLSRGRARELLNGLRIRPLLDGWRGGPPADVDALLDVVVAVGQMAVDLADRYTAVEANPVIVSPTGAVAVDVLTVQNTT
ncbi:acetate--CoA ligase family protein [Mycolicibacterium rufum]|uniref:Acetate--CoA ligase family protein n=2 Tax=Mycobacteriaceae TaxID=1762 RepID=A0A9X2XYS7_9MYCO|nr:acetate--CoA ligase family protein [Mycolicibacterium rufum]KGI66596.1 acetyl-CoA synthetase [Mycolicibacterium rufum]MCV7071311.1 acetate--CoA ligase family protein [Mycolicibacterium rufum]ULP37371.1 acetate--CoA ligase family protein [Mycolicibacterium rufum]